MDNYEFWATLAAIVVAALTIIRFVIDGQNKLCDEFRQFENRVDNRFTQIENRLGGLEQRVSAIEGWLMGRQTIPPASPPPSAE